MTQYYVVSDSVNVLRANPSVLLEALLSNGRFYAFKKREEAQKLADDDMGRFSEEGYAVYEVSVKDNAGITKKACKLESGEVIKDAFIIDRNKATGFEAKRAFLNGHVFELVDVTPKAQAKAAADKAKEAQAKAAADKAKEAQAKAAADKAKEAQAKAAANMAKEAQAKAAADKAKEAKAKALADKVVKSEVKKMAQSKKKAVKIQEKSRFAKAAEAVTNAFKRITPSVPTTLPKLPKVSPPSIPKVTLPKLSEIKAPALSVRQKLALALTTSYIATTYLLAKLGVISAAIPAFNPVGAIIPADMLATQFMVLSLGYGAVATAALAGLGYGIYRGVKEVQASAMYARFKMAREQRMAADLKADRSLLKKLEESLPAKTKEDTQFIVDLHQFDDKAPARDVVTFQLDALRKVQVAKTEDRAAVEKDLLAKADEKFKQKA